MLWPCGLSWHTATCDCKLKGWDKWNWYSWKKLVRSNVVGWGEEQGRRPWPGLFVKSICKPLCYGVNTRQFHSVLTMLLQPALVEVPGSVKEEQKHVALLLGMLPCRGHNATLISVIAKCNSDIHRREVWRQWVCDNCLCALLWCSPALEVENAVIRESTCTFPSLLSRQMTKWMYRMTKYICRDVTHFLNICKEKRLEG